jgi:transcriptional regulator with XRE-family HTH domain
MANKARQIGGLVADDIRTMSSRMRDQAKQVLARNVKRAIIEKGITPAELARRAGLTRDNISTYMRASSLPSEDSLKRLAKALGKTPEDLLPNRPDIPQSDPENPLLVLSQMPNGTSRLQLDKIMSTETANKIVALLQADNDDKAD